MINFSIVIPTYNSENTIRKCLESVFNQSILPKEVIIVDDFSNDGTRGIVNQLERLHNKKTHIIKVFLDKNTGPGMARNIGMDKATGDYICFLDSDDMFVSEKLELLSNIIISYNYPDLIAHAVNHRKDGIVRNINLVDNIFKNYIETTSAVCLKNLTYYRFPARRFAEDAALWLNIITDNKRCIHYGKVLLDGNNERTFVSGLSSQMFNMYKGVVYNYYILMKNKKIKPFHFLFFSMIASVKYLIRVIKRFHYRNRNA
ncbi:TPA: glycosyltransferase family 2 protein [Escherichia coli]